jgi:hypothetical protein
MNDQVMNETQSSRRIGRSIGALFAGLLVAIVPVIATDAALKATGVFPSSNQPMSDTLLLLATAYRAVYGVAGSYVTAWLAPNRPMQHVLALGGRGHTPGHCGSSGDMGPRRCGRARMVSHCTHFAGDAAILAGRSSAPQMAGVNLISNVEKRYAQNHPVPVV